MLAKRAQGISPFLAMEVLEEAIAMEQAGESVVHLEVGEPDFTTDPVIIQAAVQALDRGFTHYTSSMGDLALREAICAHYESQYKVSLPPDRVLVTSGSSPALLLALAALTDHGSAVVIPNPGYPCYKAYLTLLGANQRVYVLRAQDGFRFSLLALREAIGHGARAIIINSPSNPTGMEISERDLVQIANLGPCIISDEAYHGLEYAGPSHTILEYTDNAIVVNTFSKRYAMTGWRLGFLIAPPDLVRTLRNLQQNLFICANAFVQQAGIAALKHGQPAMERMRAEYDERRKYLIPRLRELGFGVEAEPTGAFYVLVPAHHLSGDSLSLARRLLREAHVAVTPGVDFGPAAQGCLRFSYANSVDNIREGLNRIRSWLETARPL